MKHEQTLAKFAIFDDYHKNEKVAESRGADKVIGLSITQKGDFTKVSLEKNGNQVNFNFEEFDEIIKILNDFRGGEDA